MVASVQLMNAVRCGLEVGLRASVVPPGQRFVHDARHAVGRWNAVPTEKQPRGALVPATRVRAPQSRGAHQGGRRLGPVGPLRRVQSHVRRRRTLEHSAVRQSDADERRQILHGPAHPLRVVPHATVSGRRDGLSRATVFGVQRAQLQHYGDIAAGHALGAEARL